MFLANFTFVVSDLKIHLVVHLRKVYQLSLSYVLTHFKKNEIVTCGEAARTNRTDKNNNISYNNNDNVTATTLSQHIQNLGILNVSDIFKALSNI